MQDEHAATEERLDVRRALLGEVPGCCPDLPGLGCLLLVVVFVVPEEFAEVEAGGTTKIFQSSADVEHRLLRGSVSEQTLDVCDTLALIVRASSERRTEVMAGDST